MSDTEAYTKWLSAQADGWAVVGRLAALASVVRRLMDQMVEQIKSLTDRVDSLAERVSDLEKQAS